MSAQKGNMREAMPTIAAWVDSLREVFGAETINPMLRGIYAIENGKAIGKPATHNIHGKPLNRVIAVSGMPDIVELLELRKTAPASVKAVAKRKR